MPATSSETGPLDSPAGDTPKPRRVSLKRDAFWTALDTLVSAGLAFLFRLVVARVLAPHEFGIAALVLALVAIFQVVNEFGLTSALIQKDKAKVTPALINSTFTAAVIVSLVLTLVTALIAAPLAAIFYGEPSIRLLVAASALSFLPTPFTTVSSALLYRERRYRVVAVNRVVSTLLSLVFAGALLLWQPSAWVVIGQVISQLIFSAIGLVLVVRWRFRLTLHREHLKEVFGFSAYILMNDLVVSFGTNAGVFILGRLVSAPQVGMFGLATYLTDTVRKSLMSILNRVTFVHYSSIQNDNAKLRQAYLTTLMWNCRAIFPVMVTIMLFGPSLLIHFLGQQWEPMGPVIRWLSLSVMIHASGGTNSTLYKGIGRPRLDMLLFMATTFLILIPGMIAGALIAGLTGVAVATAVTRLISIVIRQVLLDRIIGGTAGPVLRVVGYLLLLQAPIVIAWLVGLLWPHGWITDVALASAGLAIYGFIEIPRAFPQLAGRLGLGRSSADRNVKR